MNIQPHLANFAPQDPFYAALNHNRAELQREREATQELLLGTIQTQQEGMSALQDENALLRAQLEDARSETARAITDLEAARVANAAMARQSASQQEELARLRPAYASLQTMIATVRALEAIKKEAWPEWDTSKFSRGGFCDYIITHTLLPILQQQITTNFNETGTYIPTPEHFRSLVVELKKAESLYPAQ